MLQAIPLLKERFVWIGNKKMSLLLRVNIDQRSILQLDQILTSINAPGKNDSKG